MSKKTTPIRATVVGGVAYVSLADLDSWADNWLAQCVTISGEGAVNIVRRPPKLGSVLVDFKEQLLEIQGQLEGVRGEDHDEGDGDVEVEIEA